MTTKQKALIIASAVLLFAYLGLGLSMVHADAWSNWRQDAATVIGIALLVAGIIASITYAPRLLAWQTQQVVKEVLQEAQEERARRARQDAFSLRIRAIGLGIFLTGAVVYQCFFTPDARYSRARAKAEWLEGHKEEAITQLVENGRDLESARFLTALRLRRLRDEADMLWRETEAAKALRKASVELR